MAADFPEVLLTTEQLAAVKAALLDRVFDMDGTIQPCYHDCTFRPGYLVFSCKDNAYGCRRRRDSPLGGGLTDYSQGKGIASDPNSDSLL